jgi:hypothetical protein
MPRISAAPLPSSRLRNASRQAPLGGRGNQTIFLFFVSVNSRRQRRAGERGRPEHILSSGRSTAEAGRRQAGRVKASPDAITPTPSRSSKSFYTGRQVLRTQFVMSQASVSCRQGVSRKNLYSEFCKEL